MTVSQAGTFSIQEFTDAGIPLALGRLYTYASGTTTQKIAYTDAAGLVPHSYTLDAAEVPYIALNSRGELPAPLYLLTDGPYDLALKRPDGSSVWTRRAEGVAIASSIAALYAGSGGSALIGFLQAGTGAVARTSQDKMRELPSVTDFFIAGEADYSAAFTRALAAHNSICVPPGTYPLGANVVTLASNKRIYGAGRNASIITFTGANAFFGRAGQGAPTTDFLQNIELEGLAFQRTTFSSSAVAVQLYNVRGFRFRNNSTLRCGGASILHAIQANGTYNKSSGSTTVDPAVLAGLSATTTDDLNEDIEFSGNYINGTQSYVQGLRFEFTKRALVENNICRYANISWWGGSAVSGEGGEITMLRRVRNVTARGNYCSYANGAIYGNNGDGVTVTSNLAENIIDTGIDMEGCFNATVTGNVSRNCGNYCYSVFYGSLNTVFSNNVGIQDGTASNIGIDAGNTTYTVSVAVTGATDNGSGLVRLALTGTPRIRTGQKLVVSGVGGVTGANGTFTVTRVSATAYDLQGSTFSGAYTSGGTALFQRGNNFFRFATSGFSSNGARGVETTVKDNQWWWQGAEDLGEVGVASNLGDVEYSGNKHYNVLVDLRGNFQTGTMQITENRLRFDQAALDPRELLICGAPRGNSASIHALVVKGNVITVEGAQLAGTVGMKVTAAQNTNVIVVDDNEVTNSSGTPLTTDISFGNVTTLASTTNTTRAFFHVRRNVAETITDTSDRGRSRVEWDGNKTAAGLPLPNVGTAAAATVPTSGGWMAAMKVPWQTILASSTEGVLCTTAGAAIADANQWLATHAYVVGDQVFNGARVYYCRTAGTSAGSGGPTGTTNSITDNTVIWSYVDERARFSAYGATGAALAS